MHRPYLFLVLLWHALVGCAHGHLKKSDDKGNNKGSPFSLFWYKPHWQCGGEDTTPERAADLINVEMAGGTDFVVVGGWEAANSLGADGYGVLGSMCGYGQRGVIRTWVYGFGMVWGTVLAVLGTVLGYGFGTVISVLGYGLRCGLGTI